jgi:hypothetical protein
VSQRTVNRSTEKTRSNALIGVAIISIFIIFAAAVARLDMDNRQRNERNKVTPTQQVIGP